MRPGHKTHKTAVVVIPPEDIWEPIQRIRRKHDRQVRRWMPHITLLYPFRSPEEFDRLLPRLAEVCADVEPFEITLRDFRRFDHGGGRYTLWLAPEPAGALVRLHEAIWRVAPDCDDVRRFEAGFTPHLSVGQVRGKAAADELIRSLRASWTPLCFTVEEICLILRGDPPDDIFRVAARAPLGRSGLGDTG